MCQTYTFKRISKEKLTDFYTLFKVRAKDYSFTFFCKKYDTKWTSKEFIGVIGYDKLKNPIAHVAAFPMPIEFVGRKYRTCQLGDLIIHPDHQKKGIFPMLMDNLNIIAKEEGIDFLHASPNQQADSRFSKNGWMCFDNFKIYTFKTKCVPLNKFTNKYKLLPFHNLYIKAVLWLFGNKKTTFKNSVIENGIGGLIRSQDYSNYKKYTYNYITSINGFKIWWKIDDGLSVGDVERFDPSRLNALFKTLRFLCFIFGFHNFKIITTNNTYIDTLLKDTYSFEKGNNIYFYDISSGLDFSKIKFMQSDLNTF